MAKPRPHPETSSEFQQIDALLRPLEQERSMLLRRRQSLEAADSAFAAIRREQFLLGECDALHARLASLFDSYEELRRQRQQRKKDAERLDDALRTATGKETSWEDVRDLF